MNGAAFVPNVTFAPSANGVVAWTVAFAFFDASNVPLARLDVAPPLRTFALPQRADNFTCAISREQLANGEVWPSSPQRGGGAVVVGALALGSLLLIPILNNGGGNPARALPSPVPSSRVSPTPSPTATPSPSPTPSPAGPTLNPSSLTFSGTGSSNNRTSTLSETNYSGSFTVQSSSCNTGSVAAFSPSGNGPFGNPTTFTVTPQNSGSCTATFADSSGKTATLTIAVTTTSVIIQGRRRR